MFISNKIKSLRCFCQEFSVSNSCRYYCLTEHRSVAVDHPSLQGRGDVVDVVTLPLSRCLLRRVLGASVWTPLEMLLSLHHEQ